MVPRGKGQRPWAENWWDNPTRVTDKQLGGREVRAGSRMALKCMNVWERDDTTVSFFFLLRPTREPRGAHLASWCREVISETDTHMSLIEVSPLGGEEPNHETAAGIKAVRWWSADASNSIQLHSSPLNFDLLTARLELHKGRFKICAKHNNLTAEH